jgi:predicted lipid-binding transport protein (Tim44 family)
VTRLAASLCAVALLVALGDTALAAPGGGSSGFGGGGGGGGGGYGGGGSGSGSGGSPWFTFVIGAAFVLFLAFAIVQAARLRRRRRHRVARVELASAEAAADDAAFAASAVREAAAELMRGIMAAWTARDRDGLRARLGPDLLVEWELRLDDFDRKGWHNVCELRSGPEVEYVGLANRAADDDDRVVVRLRSQLRDVVVDRNGNTITRKGSESEITSLAEYWTLGKRDGDWILLSIEQDAEGAHHLDAPIVASPWSDDERLRDEAVTELAAADAVPDADVAGLADLDFDGDARAAALDLSNVDGRFAPDVLEVAARRAVQGWAEAVDGDDAALLAVAAPAAARALLHPGDPSGGTRLVVRGPRLTALRITALDAAARPATMTVEADVTGRRYLEDRDTAAVLDGSKERETTFTERWTLALDGAGPTPWRIVEAAAPARS